MKSKIRTAERTSLIAVLAALAAIAALTGCQPTQQQMQKQALEMMQQSMQQQIALLAEFNRSITGFGLVSIQPKPSGAELLIDGAEVLGDADSLAIPLGVHEFTARWPDGTTATRRVFVPQMVVTYNLNYEATMSRSKGSVKYSGKQPDAKKTVIVLEKPKQAH